MKYEYEVTHDADGNREKIRKWEAAKGGKCVGSLRIGAAADRELVAGYSRIYREEGHIIRWYLDKEQELFAGIYEAG